VTLRLLADFEEDPRPCDYVAGRVARLQYRVMAGVSLAEHDRLLTRGWRRFGPVYFRPACSACAECVSLRIPVAGFVPTTSQKRALRRAQRFRVVLARPRVDAQRLALFHAWHADREHDRGWKAAEMSADEYALQFAHPHAAAHELTLWDGDRLVLVGLADVSPAAWSAVYCFYDPSIARLSPGVANVVFGVLLARERQIPHVYLGFRVQGCVSMRYKADFTPHELLSRPCEDDQEPVWV
jgi:arginyl-tRNA--protein-N-Asp/Glu arginylyltransferase